MAVDDTKQSARDEWLGKLNRLVDSVKQWADLHGWATKRTVKKMDDVGIGSYEAPAMLFQDGPARLFLEPISRVAPGTEGLVDLCLMPSYADVASLYFYNKSWHIHYVFNEKPSVAKGREAKARPLTEKTFVKVLDEMKAHV